MIKPGDARTFANSTYGASERLVDFYSSYVVSDLVLFCLFLLFLFVFFLRCTIGESGIGPAPVFFFVGGGG